MKTLLSFAFFIGLLSATHAQIRYADIRRIGVVSYGEVVHVTTKGGGVNTQRIHIYLSDSTSRFLTELSGQECENLIDALNTIVSADYTVKDGIEKEMFFNVPNIPKIHGRGFLPKGKNSLICYLYVVENSKFYFSRSELLTLIQFLKNALNTMK